jgi:hypothetical protein
MRNGSLIPKPWPLRPVRLKCPLLTNVDDAVPHVTGLTTCKTLVSPELRDFRGIRPRSFVIFGVCGTVTVLTQSCITGISFSRRAVSAILQQVLAIPRPGWPPRFPPERGEIATYGFVETGRSPGS